jgi:hypothetical protein
MYVFVCPVYHKVLNLVSFLENLGGKDCVRSCLMPVTDENLAGWEFRHLCIHVQPLKTSSVKALYFPPGGYQTDLNLESCNWTLTSNLKKWRNGKEDGVTWQHLISWGGPGIKYQFSYTKFSLEHISQLPCISYWVDHHCICSLGKVMVRWNSVRTPLRNSDRSIQ